MCSPVHTAEAWQATCRLVLPRAMLPRDATSPVPRGPTQPNLTDLEYWATGLTAVYLEGALERTLAGPTRLTSPAPVETPAFDGPAPAWVPASADPGSHARAGSVLCVREGG
jgi:hypothetical protein